MYIASSTLVRPHFLPLVAMHVQHHKDPVRQCFAALSRISIDDSNAQKEAGTVCKSSTIAKDLSLVLSFWFRSLDASAAQQTDCLACGQSA